MIILPPIEYCKAAILKWKAHTLRLMYLFMAGDVVREVRNIYGTGQFPVNF